MSEEREIPPPAKDPMRSFRGVMAGTLIMEAITVALALPVIAKLEGGVTSVQGWAVMGMAVLFVACCALLRKPWITWVILGMQVVLIGFFITLKAVGFIGLVFGGLWFYLFWLRRDVARRMAAGTLPSQQA